MNLRTGCCQCGENTFSMQGEPTFVLNCHCLDCQKSSGSGHTTMAIFSTQSLERHGKTSLYKHLADSGTEVTREFCPTCGSRLYNGNMRIPTMTAIALAAFDDSSTLTPALSVYSCRAQPWDHLAEGIPAFERMPPHPI